MAASMPPSTIGDIIAQKPSSNWSFEYLSRRNFGALNRRMKLSA
jgi:hypothetical protein